MADVAVQRFNVVFAGAYIAAQKGQMDVGVLHQLQNGGNTGGDNPQMLPLPQLRRQHVAGLACADENGFAGLYLTGGLPCNGKFFPVRVVQNFRAAEEAFFLLLGQTNATVAPLCQPLFL